MSNRVVDAYADMVSERKEQYIDSILELIDDEGDVSVDKMHLLYDTLTQYVLLDLTYRKLVDVYMRT